MSVVVKSGSDAVGRALQFDIPTAVIVIFATYIAMSSRKGHQVNKYDGKC